MKDRYVNLFEICQPKQWPTLPINSLQKEGFPVYGANGRIGFFNTYNHIKKTITITCRGATSGTVNECEPFSYITGNSMALDNLNEERVNRRFLFYFLKKRGFQDIISGSAQPQITRIGLKKVAVPLPPLPIQRRIAAVLDNADRLRKLRKTAIEKLDQLAQAVFIDMFGDPVTNPKGWEKCKLNELGYIITGNTPSRKKVEYYGDYIEWIKSDNINTPFDYLTKSTEYLSKEGLEVGRMAQKNSILVTCIAGSKHCIGNASIANRDVSFNQQINAIIPSQKTNLFFLYMQFKIGKKLIQEASTNGMKGLVSKEKFKNILFINPPLSKQIYFEKIFKLHESLKEKMNSSFNKYNDLFNSLLQRAFKGELTFNDKYFETLEESFEDSHE